MSTASDGDPKSGAPAEAGHRASVGKGAWSWRGLARLAIAVVIGAAAASPWLDVYIDRLNEPRCQPAGQDAPAAGCIARMRIGGIDIDKLATVGLTPDGGTLVVAGVTDTVTKTQVLAGLAVADGKEEWRAPLEHPDVPMISVSPGGTKAAVWDVTGGSPVYVVGVPGGALLGEVVVPDRFDDVVFSEDETSIVVGAASNRRVISLSDPAAEPATAPGFDRPGCGGGGLVGQSTGSDVPPIMSLRSRDNGMALFLRQRDGDIPLRSVRTSSADWLVASMCGTKAVAVLPVDADHWFASFSPRNKRLAIVYSKGPSQTVIEVWEAGYDRYLQRLAAFPIRGGVGARIGWSQDEHHLAAIRTNQAGTDAFIYWIP